MYILWTIIIGFVIGLISRFLLPGRDSDGFLLTPVLGIVGAVVGTFLGQLLGLYQSAEPAGFIMAVLGALLIIVVFRKFTRTTSVIQC